MTVFGIKRYTTRKFGVDFPARGANKLARMKRRHLVLIASLLLAAGVWLSIGSVKRADVARKRASAEVAQSASAEARQTAKSHSEFVKEWNASHPPQRKGTNAADIYRQAFELFDALTDDEKEMIKSPRDEVDADKAEELFKKIQPILELMRQAGVADYSDWGTGPVRFNTPMPHLVKSMELGRLALWSAAYRFKDDPRGAVNDLAARTPLARSLSGTLIGFLVGTSFENSATDLVAQNAGAMDAVATAQFTAMLRDPSYADGFSRAMEGEVSGVRAFADEIATATTADEAYRKLAPLSGNLDDIQPTVAEMQAAGFDLASVKAGLQKVIDIDQQFGRTLGMPESQFQAWWSQVNADTNPIVKLLLPTLDSVRSKALTTQVQRAMLGAGIAVMQNGPAQLDAFTDPTTGSVFTYAPTADGGFELRSTFQVKGKPVTMAFPSARR